MLQIKPFSYANDNLGYPDNLFYTLGEEIRVNPYLCINDEKIAAILKDKGLPSETEFERWQSLLSLM